MSDELRKINGKVALVESLAYWSAQAEIRFGPVKKLMPPEFQNPHAIVGNGHRCLCGSYASTSDGGNISITCADVLSVLEHAEYLGFKELEQDLKILRAVITPLLEDRPVRVVKG